MSLRAGGAAHDMNNLLAAIAGRCEMLLHQAPDDSLSSDLRSVRDTALRAASLTRDLLAFRRSDDPKPKRTDLNRLVEGMRGTIQDLAGSGVLLLTVLAPDLGTIYVDPSMFERVITNLALNAAQAMPRGGTLTIETSNVEALPDQRGAGVALTIRDTGVGMNEETRARLFEPFFTTRPTGTGLGLPTVRRIVEQHGGQIAFDSEPGRGTTFRVCLPRA
jgi:signal transduction histidine kinase